MSTKNAKLPIMETFFSIQGEGFHAGIPAWFIRLAGCDVGCVWCDETKSWNAENFPKYEISQIISAVDKSCVKTIIITGGEPMMYDLTELTYELKKSGFKTHLETYAAYPLSGRWDWICLSPKKFKPALQEYFPLANELKIIVCNRSDFEWAEKYKLSVSPKCMLYLQPEWNRQREVFPLIIEYIRNNPDWKISLQMHKYVGMP